MHCFLTQKQLLGINYYCYSPFPEYFFLVFYFYDLIGLPTVIKMYIFFSHKLMNIYIND